MPEKVAITLEYRLVCLHTWRWKVSRDFTVPVYFLDADLKGNTVWDRVLTGCLYGGDDHYRFCQKVLLGIGDVRMLRSLGFQDIERFHMNKGPSCLCRISSIVICLDGRRYLHHRIYKASIKLQKGETCFCNKLKNTGKLNLKFDLVNLAPYERTLRYSCRVDIAHQKYSSIENVTVDNAHPTTLISSGIALAFQVFHNLKEMETWRHSATDIINC